MTNILQLLIDVLDYLSIAVIVWGVFLAVVAFIKSEISAANRKDAVHTNNEIKNRLGSYILFGLEILIAADIIETILNPTFDDIIMLASIVVIRTAISFFLTKEIEASK
ncbi:DUF1622 domain-containing protein [Isobaculum melis]|uniref:Uncharacterized membrane protein n=1 Tax=Isobaculum melis TaxID=142588 RepID=A0A1H9PPM0_9LACT|nr:DUF1622 domain-containing protein [Isobaculum melis]SER50164.1 Uncharacterized membrane protein [Isobaculum melis]